LVKVELRRCQCETADSNCVWICLFLVIFIFFAEELKSTISSCIHTSKSHIYSVAQPRIQTVHWIG
jgi:hypothetical protein